MPAAVEIRNVRDAETTEFRAANARGFGYHLRPDETMDAVFRRRFDPQRFLGAFDNGSVVGTAAAFPYTMTLPGCAPAPVAGVTSVTVMPTHRRQGILTRMMARQLKDARDRGEMAAILWASESSIYSRFGYGLAIWHESWEIARDHADLSWGPEVGGRVRLVSPEDARRLFPDPWERLRTRRAGMVARPDYEWDNVLHDPDWKQRGATALFHAVYEQGDLIDGYVLYRIRRGSRVVALLPRCRPHGEGDRLRPSGRCRSTVDAERPAPPHEAAS
jgi:predicted acetyltransferase